MVRMILRDGERGVSRDHNFADLHLGSFVDVERKRYGVRARQSFVGGLDGGELAAVLGQQLLNNHFRLLDFCRIELAFNREADLAVLEPVQDVGFGDRFVALVFDAPDDGPLGDIENDDFLVGLVRAVLDFETDVLEILRVPQGVEIAPQGVIVHGVAGAGKDARPKRLAADSSIALEFDALDDRRCLPGSRLAACCACAGE